MDNHPGDRREDRWGEYAEQLEEMLRHGSRNFRRYRRRAMAAFAMVVAAASFAVWRAEENRRDLAEAMMRVQATACDRGNDVRRSLVDFLRVIRAHRDLIDQAGRSFAPVDCERTVLPLERLTR